MTRGLPPPPLALGAPGIYRAPRTPAGRRLGVPMDVAAFVGVAPRGPAREPVVNAQWPDDRPCVEPGRPRRRSLAVAVEDFDAYRRLYGGFEGPGRLPYALAAFFEQGGRKAYVVRVVHRYGDADDTGGVAAGAVAGCRAPAVADGAVRLVARNEGTWGNGLRAAMGFAVSPLGFEAVEGQALVLAAEEVPSAGSLLRLTLDDESWVLRWVTEVTSRPRTDAPGREALAALDAPLAQGLARAEVVTGELLVDDGDGRREGFQGLGLSPAHPRFLATVLCRESALVLPHAQWSAADLLPLADALLPIAPELSAAAPFSGGEDRWEAITRDDFFPVAGDGGGIAALEGVDEVVTVVVPDLYSPEELDPVTPDRPSPPLAGPRFAPCPPSTPPFEPPGVPSVSLPGLRYDPGDPDALERVTAAQRRLVDWAEARCDRVVVLDVPPGLPEREVARWRNRLTSAYAAAYHPWLRVSRPDDRRERLQLLPPSAVAAGVVAATELAHGIAFGPANALARGVVAVEEVVPPQRHDRLHPLGINVFLQERDGVRLAAARTLARDPAYRQLSVRRLMLMLRRVLAEQMQWMVFEPNGPALRAQVRHLLRAYLGQLYRAGAFRGADEEEAFFVRCDEVLNPPSVMDAGRLVAEVGVAPAEPIEFLVLRLVREGDGRLVVET